MDILMKDMHYQYGIVVQLGIENMFGLNHYLVQVVMIQETQQEV